MASTGLRSAGLQPCGRWTGGFQGMGFGPGRQRSQHGIGLGDLAARRLLHRVDVKPGHVADPLEMTAATEQPATGGAGVDMPLGGRRPWLALLRCAEQPQRRILKRLRHDGTPKNRLAGGESVGHVGQWSGMGAGGASVRTSRDHAVNHVKSCWFC